MDKKEQDLEYLKAAALAVERQLMENPSLGIAVDPDVAESWALSKRPRSAFWKPWKPMISRPGSWKTRSKSLKFTPA